MKKHVFHVGDVVTFGLIDEKEIEWKILTTDGEDALIASCYAVSSRAYDVGSSPATWETCSLRTWLNQDFLHAAFSDKEREETPDNIYHKC